MTKQRMFFFKKTLINDLTFRMPQHTSFEILATRRSDVHCQIKETLLIKDLKPALNENVGSEKLSLY